MADRGSQQWRDNISLGKRAAQRERSEQATSVDEYQALLDTIARGEDVAEEEKPLAERVRTIDFDTMAPTDIVVTRRFSRDDGA